MSEETEHFLLLFLFIPISSQHLSQIPQSEVFLEVELRRDVAVPSKNLDRNGLVLQRYIVTRLLENLLSEKAGRELDYFLAVTSLKSILKGESVNESGDVSFLVLFKRRTFLPLRGEVLQGVVYATFSCGIILRCGPVKYI